MLKYSLIAGENAVLDVNSCGPLHFKGLRYATTASFQILSYRGADKSLARPGRKKATATEDFDFYISYL
jgi:hypothetical protein